MNEYQKKKLNLNKIIYLERNQSNTIKHFLNSKKANKLSDEKWIYNQLLFGKNNYINIAGENSSNTNDNNNKNKGKDDELLKKELKILKKQLMKLKSLLKKKLKNIVEQIENNWY